MVQPTLFTGKQQMQSSGNLKSEALSFCINTPTPSPRKYQCPSPGGAIRTIIYTPQRYKRHPCHFQKGVPFRFNWAVKMESTRELSNFNFQWTKTLYQNNLTNITFFFTIFKGYRRNQSSVITPKKYSHGSSRK